MTSQEIQDSLAFLASLEFFGIKLGLDQTREVFRRLGNPEQSLSFIHVAGSNGKGSTCALLESAFRNAGLKTGFYSSPHLVNVGERFKINGVDATDEEVAECIVPLRKVIAGMERDGMKVTYFEATTAIAAMLFAKNNVDVVLWETGMGGRLDSTNIVTPVASVITGISLEHSERLGDTLGKIAFEKAGIIKEGIPVFVAEMTPPEAKNVIFDRAKELNSPYIPSAAIAEDQQIQITLNEDKTAALQSFSLCDRTDLQTPLMGPHQRENAALAYAVLKYLKQKNVIVFDLQKALAGFAKTNWDARFQIFPERKLIVDAAHNPEGAQVLAQTLREVMPGEKFHFLFGAFADKDTGGGMRALIPLAHSFRFIHMETMRTSRSTEELIDQLHNDLSCDIPADGMTLTDALQNEYADGAWRVLCGSLHLCGEALPYLTTNNGSI